ncbi:hypothetical protein V6C27_02270 [Peptococcaceae bacterium 1198_IL3148]
MENSYDIFDTTLIDKLVLLQRQQKNLDEGDELKFKADLVFFVNFLNSQLRKDLTEADELDIVKYKDFIREDYTFKDIIDRRLNSAKIALKLLKQIQ